MKVAREDVIGIIRNARVIADPEVLRDDATLTDQGLDSLDVFNIILQLQERFEIDIPDADIDRLVRIPDIIDYLNQRLASV